MRPLDLNYGCHLLRAVRSRAISIPGRLFLGGLGVEYGERLRLRGMPIVHRWPGSSIVLGKRVVLVSYSADTALGVNHPVKIETLAVGARIVIGDDTGISGGSFCAQVSVEIGARCLLGANVTIADTDFHPLAVRNRRYAVSGAAAAPVTVEDDVFLGANVIVLKGVRIGKNSVVGAGSVVTKEIPAHSVAAGNPCRVLRHLTEAELAGTSTV